jgi:TatD DNase family protein
MLVNIHTHNDCSVDNLQIKNLSLSEAETVLTTVKSGFFSVGIHPRDIENHDSTGLDLLNIHAANNMVVAIGECGLDKNIKTSFDKQLDFFEKQIIISETFKKFLVIHCVGYFNELMDLQKRVRPSQKWIIHGFRGKPQLATQLLKNGISLSFGEKFNPESVKIIPFDNLYIETDESEIPLEELYNRIASIKGCNIPDLCAGFNLLKKYF